MPTAEWSDVEILGENINLVTLLTLEDLQKEFGAFEIQQLSDRNDDDVPDSDVIANAINSAVAEVFSSISGRVPLPLPDPLPTIAADRLRRIAADIARFLLYNDAPTDLVVRRYEMAVQWLRDFARGVHELPGLTGADAATPTGFASSVAPVRLFTASTLADF